MPTVRSMTPSFFCQSSCQASSSAWRARHSWKRSRTGSELAPRRWASAAPIGRNYHYDFVVRGLRFHGSTGTKNRAAAQQVEAAKRIEAAIGAIRRRPMTMNEAAERFYQEIAQHQASGDDVDRWLARLVKRVEPGRLLSEIDDDLVARIVGERRVDRARNKKAPVSPGTVNREVPAWSRPVFRSCSQVTDRVPNSLKERPPEVVAIRPLS